MDISHASRNPEVSRGTLKIFTQPTGRVLDNPKGSASWARVVLDEPIRRADSVMDYEPPMIPVIPATPAPLTTEPVMDTNGIPGDVLRKSTWPPCQCGKAVCPESINSEQER